MIQSPYRVPRFLLKPLLGTVEIDWGHPLARGLVGYWLFNEGTGNVVKDLTGLGHDGSFDAGPSWTTSIYGAVADLNTSNFVSCGTKSDLANTSLSVAFRMKGGNVPNNISDVALAKTNAGTWTQGWGWYWNTDIRFFIEAYNTNFAIGPTGLTYTDWHSFAGTWDGSTIACYADGVRGTDGTYSGAITSTNNMAIGTDGGTTFDYPSLMSYVGVWTVALSDGSVSELVSNPYAFLRPKIVRYYSFPSGAAATGLAWKLAGYPPRLAGVGGLAG